jgi:hypothetical protein
MLPAAVAASGVRPTGVFTGRGWNTLEVVIAQAPGRPSVASSEAAATTPTRQAYASFRKHVARCTPLVTRGNLWDAGAASVTRVGKGELTVLAPAGRA